jgi:hypothetical protein
LLTDFTSYAGGEFQALFPQDDPRVRGQVLAKRLVVTAWDVDATSPMIFCASRAL